MKIIKKYKTMSLPIKAAIWFTIVNFIVKGISFITVPFFSFYLSTEEYGKMSIFQTYQGILINFATFEMYSGAYIRGILRYKDNVPLFTKSEQLLSSLITIFCFVLCIPIQTWLISKAQIDFKIYVLMYGYFLFFPAYQCWVGRKRFSYEYKPVVISGIFYSVLSTLIPLIAIIKIDATSSVKLSWMFIVEVAFCLPFFVANMRIGSLRSNKETIREQWKFLLSFQAPSVVHALSYIILSSMDRIMIGEMVGNAEAGIYSVATTIASVITILSMSANQVLKPWRYQRMEKKDYVQIKSKSTILLFAFGIAIMLWILIAPDVMHLFFKKEYHQAIWAIPPISMSVFFIFLYSMFVDIEEFFYKTKYTMYATTISAIINIILNYFAIKIWGFIACAYTTLICYVLLALLHLFWSNKASQKEGISIREIYDVKKICVFSGILLIAEIAVTVTYSYSIFRYSLLVILILLSCINIKRIYSMIMDVLKK